MFSGPVDRNHFALRPQKRGGLGGEGDERMKARPRIPPEKDRRDRGLKTKLRHLDSRFDFVCVFTG